MLRFLVRGAVRAAVHSHLQDKHAREAAWRLQQSSPFALTPNQTGESALYLDRRAGFSHALPGYPRAIQPVPDPNEPAADTLVALAEMPMFIRYRLDRPPIPASTAGEYADKLTASYAANRTQGRTPIVAQVRTDQTVAYGVEAAARTTYSLSYPDAFGCDAEELLVLVRAGAALAITFRYPRDTPTQDWLRYALFTSAAFATPRWDPHRFQHASPIWPPSSFLDPGLSASLNHHKVSVLPQVAPVMQSLSSSDREAISACFGTIVQRDEPPWMPISPDALAAHRDAIFACSDDSAFRNTVHQALGEVRTMHDLRGVCVFFGRAMNG